MKLQHSEEEEEEEEEEEVAPWHQEVNMLQQVVTAICSRIPHQAKKER